MGRRGSVWVESAVLVGAFLPLAGCAPSPGPVEADPPAIAVATLAGPSSEASATVGPPVPLALRMVDKGGVGRFDLVEFEVETDADPANPFDPDEFEIRVEFTAPSGRTSDVGAFWYREYSPPLGILGKGDPSWRVRFSPTEVGRWRAVARIPGRGIESAPVAFEVEPSENPGFVRVHPENPRYLAFDDGRTFFPIGANMAWWSGSGTPLGDYGKWMAAFAGNGGNTIRVWMADWSFALEGPNTPLGDYTNRLGKAWLLDEVLRMAEDRNLYVILVLLNCADYNDWQTNGWNSNPYKASRGGPLEQPGDFATDPTARAYLRRKLNYIVNRWGYSTHLLAWEWWNEVNLTPISDEALIPWLQEMTADLRTRDVNRHLVTNSYAIRSLSPIWDLPEIDIIQKHEYALQVGTEDHDLAGRAARDLRELSNSAPPKPVLLGEFGYGAEATADDIERTGIHLHNGLWSTTFAGYAGTGMYWYWDVYLDAYHQWHQFAPLSSFLEGEDLSEYEPFSPLAVTDQAGRPATVDGLGLHGEKILVWMRSDAYTVPAAVEAWRAAGSPNAYAYNPPALEGLTLTLEGMLDGDYTVEWFDPQRGRWLETAGATSEAGMLEIGVPSFRRDLAGRVVPGG